MSDPQPDAGSIWIYETLSGDATLTAMATGTRIYDDQVPQNATYPLIQYRTYFDLDRQTMRGLSYLVRSDYMVVAVDRSDDANAIIDPGTLVPIRDRIHVLLHQQMGQNDHGIIQFAARVIPYRRPYEHNGVRYLEYGGQYRLWITPLP